MDVRPGAASFRRQVHVGGVDLDDAVHAPRVNDDAVGPLRQITLGVGHAAAARHDGNT